MRTTIAEHRQRLRRGAVYHGSWLMTASPDVARISGAMGFDYVCIDMQHGFARADAIVPMIDAIRAAGESMVVVRVPENSFTQIGMAADAGADAIIVPLVSSAREAQAAVGAVSFPSQGGDRSWGPTSAIFGGDELDPEHLRPLLFAMVENAAALEDVDAIAAVPGLDGIYVGPSDLAFGVGSAPGPEDQVTTDAIARILEAARAAGVIPGIHTSGGPEAMKRRGQGFGFITSACDAVALRAGYAADLEALKERTE